MSNHKASAKHGAPTIKVGAVRFTLAMGTTALIALERVRDIGFMRLPEMFEDTRLESLRDLLAAALIEHHPQSPADIVGSGMTSLVEALGSLIGTGVAAGPAYDWEAQQALADSVLDRTGAFAVMKALGKAFCSSPHLKGEGRGAGED